MSGYIEIPADGILRESKVEFAGWHDIPYIIYIAPDEPRYKIWISTKYSREGKKVRLCVHYNRALCRTLEEYNGFPTEYVEGEVYGSWMDGAR